MRYGPELTLPPTTKQNSASPRCRDADQRRLLNLAR